MSPTDPQSRAYRDSTDVDQFDGDLDAIGAITHDPIVDASQVRMPGFYERIGWDVDRLGPKDIEQARTALTTRIADPAAPDTAAETGAYGRP